MLDDRWDTGHLYALTSRRLGCLPEGLDRKKARRRRTVVSGDGEACPWDVPSQLTKEAMVTICRRFQHTPGGLIKPHTRGIIPPSIIFHPGQCMSILSRN